MKSDEKARANGPGGFRFGIGSMLVVVACFAAFFWAWRIVNDSMRPSKGWANALRSGSVEERRVAAHELGEVGPEDVEVAVPTLLTAMNDPDEAVAAVATSAMGEAGLTALRPPNHGPEARTASLALIATLNDPRAEVRAMAVIALGDFARPSNPSGFPTDPLPMASALAGRMIDDSPKVRKQAARALGLIGTAAPIEPPDALVWGLSRWESAEVRADAATTLGMFAGGSDRAIPALIAALKDRDRQVRSAAAAALGRFGPKAKAALPALVEVLDEPYVEPPPLPDRIALMRIAPPPAGVFIEPPPGDPAVAAAESIGDVLIAGNPPPAVLDALIATLRSEHPSRRHGAEVALLDIGRNALPALPALIVDLAEAKPGHGGPAASALGVMAPDTPSAPMAIAALVAALDSPHPGIRINAAASLGKFGLAAAPALPKLRALDHDPDLFLAQAAKESAQAIMAAARPGDGDSDGKR